MAKTVEIYSDDLTPEAQERLLRTFETDQDQENWESVPSAVIEREFDDPYP
ncbi:MAG: hypothetical protein JSW39_10105 [Desulfobacterales bacterium]|nr:MAG: hypothetical protein JSW39_10105 [Desulfobacterales bacterium]